MGTCKKELSGRNPVQYKLLGPPTGLQVSKVVTAVLLVLVWDKMMHFTFKYVLVWSEQMQSWRIPLLVCSQWPLWVLFWSTNEWGHETLCFALGLFFVKYRNFSCFCCFGFFILFFEKWLFISCFIFGFPIEFFIIYY